MDDHAEPGTGFDQKGVVTRGFGRFVRDEHGATAIEYALVAVGIALAVAAVVFGTGSSLKTGFYDKMNAAIRN